MANRYERLQAEWSEKYAAYTPAMLERRVGTLTKQVDTKRRSAESAKWDRRGKGQRLQSIREQRAHTAAAELSSERRYVETLLAQKTAAQKPNAEHPAEGAES